MPPRDEADRLFAMLCSSGWLRKLAKCRRPECGRYLWLKHWKRTYKNGTFCPKCTRARIIESAKRNTLETRQEAENNLYGLVAARFGKRIVKNPEWRRDRKLREGIINFLNGRIRASNRLASVYPHGITGKWLSWSKNQIGLEKATRGGR